MPEPIVPDRMEAWVCPRYGPASVLRRETVSLPPLRPDSVLIRVLATTVTSGDVRVRGADFPPGMRLGARIALGWNGPRRTVLGSQAAGIVAACGERVTRFAPGQRVVAFPDMRMGAHARYLAMPEQRGLVEWPEGLAEGEAASLFFGGHTARHFLRRAGLAAGQRLLVIGAAGTVGSALVQLARAQGIAVTAGCAEVHAPALKALGAQATLDTRGTSLAGLGEQWDCIADCPGALDFGQALPLLRDGGSYLAIAGGIREMLARGREGKRIVVGPASGTDADLMALAALAARGEYRPQVGRVFVFETLPDAHRSVERGGNLGSVVVTMGGKAMASAGQMPLSPSPVAG